MVVQPYGFPFVFQIGKGNLTILEFSSIDEGNAAIQSGGGLPVAGCSDSFSWPMISHSAGYVTRLQICHGYLQYRYN
jgi:hypothetical protein